MPLKRYPWQPRSSFCLDGFACSKYLIWVESHTICHSVAGFVNAESSRFICAMSSVRNFLLEPEYCSVLRIYRTWSVRPSVHGRWVCFCLLSLVNNAAVSMRVQCLFLPLLSFLLRIYPEVNLLDHTVILPLIF